MYVASEASAGRPAAAPTRIAPSTIGPGPSRAPGRSLISRTWAPIVNTIWTVHWVTTNGRRAAAIPKGDSNTQAARTSIAAKATPKTAKACRLGACCRARWNVGSRAGQQMKPSAMIGAAAATERPVSRGAVVGSPSARSITRPSRTRPTPIEATPNQRQKESPREASATAPTDQVSIVPRTGQTIESVMVPTMAASPAIDASGP